MLQLICKLVLSNVNLIKEVFNIKKIALIICSMIGVIALIIIGYSIFNIYSIKKEENMILTEWYEIIDKIPDNNDCSANNITINGEDVIAVIKSINKSVPILLGTSNNVLKKGAGWSEYSAEFGEDGSSMVFGHRDSVFRFLKDINLGDELTIETVDSLFEYEVINTKIVNPEDIVISKGEGPNQLKLITCYPFRYIGNAPQRFIVTASLKNKIICNGGQNEEKECVKSSTNNYGYIK